MADQPEEIIGECDGTGYRAPQLKSLNEIRKLDQEDESLKRYKAALLGSIELNEVPCKCFPHPWISFTRSRKSQVRGN